MPLLGFGCGFSWSISEPARVVLSGAVLRLEWVMITVRRTATALLPATAALLVAFVVATLAWVAPPPAPPEPGDEGYVLMAPFAELERVDVDPAALFDAVSRDLGHGPALTRMERVREAGDTGLVCVCDNGVCATIAVSADFEREYWRRYAQLLAQRREQLRAKYGDLLAEYWFRWSEIARSRHSG